jgi:hypothetical protein
MIMKRIVSHKLGFTLRSNQRMEPMALRATAHPPSRWTEMRGT